MSPIFFLTTTPLVLVASLTALLHNNDQVRFHFSQLMVWVNVGYMVIHTMGVCAGFVIEQPALTSMGILLYLVHLALIGILNLQLRALKEQRQKIL